MARRGRYNTQSQLRGGINAYRVTDSAQHFTPEEARAEYARLRREANRRLEVLRRSEFKSIKAVTNRPGEFEALPRGMSEKNVRKALYDVARFINLKTSSLKGARAAQRQFIETMHEHGYTFVNKSNAAEFGRFMGDIQKQAAAAGYDSGDADDSEGYASLFKIAKQKNIDPEDMAKHFEFWMEHRDELVKIPKIKGDPVSTSIFTAKIGLSID